MTLKSRKNTIQRGIGTMIEPIIDMKSFIKDVDDGMSAYDLQAKYIITPRQYRYLMRGINRKQGYSLKKGRVKPYKTRSYFNEPHITLKKDGYYIIRKNNVYYGQYKSLPIAKKVKKELIKVKWDKKQLNGIRKSLGLKPMREYQL